MPKVEIEESELAALRNVNAFVDTGLKNPKTRKQMLAIDRLLHPDKSIPELDATEGVMAAVNEVKETVAGLLTKMNERDTASEETRRTAELASRVQKGQEYLTANGYNAEGVKKIEDLMLAENISSYAAGLALFERLNPAPTPADNSRTPRFGDLSGNDVTSVDYKDLWESQGQSDKWLNDSIANVRKDFRQ